MQERHFERLSALASTRPRETGDTYQIAGVAIGEGDVTKGLSGKKTLWDADTLADAAEKLGESKVLKGRSGQGHKPMSEQADPEEIVGRVEWDYDPGVGLTYQGELLDEGLAQRVELGVLDVSPDLYRRLGEQNADGHHTVDEIVDIPYLTLVDRGAGPSARVELTDAEAEQAAERMAQLLDAGDGDGADVRPEQLQPDDDPADAPAPDVGDAVRWESDAAGSVNGWRYGVVVDGLDADDEPDDSVLVATYEPGDDGWDNRNDQNPIREDRLVPIGSDGTGSLPPIDQLALDDDGDLVEQQTAAQTGVQADDGPAEPGATTPSTSDMTDDDDSLKEQLTELRTERNELREQLEEHEENVEQLEAQLDEKDETVEQLESSIESKDETIDTLEERLEPVRELLAEVATDGSPLDAETIANKSTVPELISQLSDDELEADDDVDYTEQIKEQLSSTVAPRGEGVDDETGSDQLSAEEREHADQMAQSVMTLDDMRDMDRAGLDPHEYLSREYDLDPLEYNSEARLREAVQQNGGEA